MNARRWPVAALGFLFAGLLAGRARVVATDVAPTLEVAYAIHYVDAPTNIEGRVKALAARAESRFVPSANAAPGAWRLDARREDDMQAAPPASLRSLSYFGRGLTGAQAEALQHARIAWLLDFHYPRGDVWPATAAANRFVADLARETYGFIYDIETRETFTPEAFAQQRLFDGKSAPDVAAHTIVHAYKDGEFVRAISLGMKKFGLPDLVIEGFPWSLNRPLGFVLTGAQQAYAEGSITAERGAATLDLRALRHPTARAKLADELAAASDGRVKLMLAKVPPEEGDPDNRLVALRFDAYTGGDAHERQATAAASLFGATSTVQLARHDAEFERAIARARAELPALKRAFARVLAPGEFIDLKVPFDADDGGHEYMWVEVGTWSADGHVRGLLRNEPRGIAGLHGGATVDVDEADAVDFLRRHADGREEGGYTVEAMRKQAAARE